MIAASGHHRGHMGPCGDAHREAVRGAARALRREQAHTLAKSIHLIG